MFVMRTRHEYLGRTYYVRNQKKTIRENILTIVHTKPRSENF